jgi:hypothetical protein
MRTGVCECVSVCVERRGREMRGRLQGVEEEEE